MRGTPVREWTEDFDESTSRPFDPGHDDDVDADMDVGAADQDFAVAAFLRDLPDDHRIEEIEDHDVLGIDAEVAQEVPERPPETLPKDVPAPRRADLARLLEAEEFADKVRHRLR